jgi:hypothetical protein
MKLTIVGLSAATGISCALYLVFGGTALLVGVSTISLLTLTISCFTLGIWYSHKSIQLGAKIATEAVSNNDKWDTVKMQSLAQFGGEIFKLKGQGQGNENEYPLLEDISDGQFMITGIDDE